MITESINAERGRHHVATASWGAAALRRFSAGIMTQSARGLAHSKTSRKFQRGILLVDCMVYIGLFFLITGVAFSFFYSCWDGSLALRRNTDDITSALKAGETWRADVRNANGPLRIENSADGQLLHVPEKSGEVVYRYEAGSLWRVAANQEPRQLLPKIKSSRMESEQRQQVTAWRWEIELPIKKHTAQVHPLFTFEAVPNL
jgi:hypothetical protein